MTNKVDLLVGKNFLAVVLFVLYLLLEVDNYVFKVVFVVLALLGLFQEEFTFFVKFLFKCFHLFCLRINNVDEVLSKPLQVLHEHRVGVLPLFVAVVLLEIDFGEL